MVDGICTKKMEEKLETINKGKKTIESARVLADVPSNNSKDDMFNIIKEVRSYITSQKRLWQT